MEELDPLYQRVRGHLSPEEFQRRVESKVTALGNLIDHRTAALLVLEELGVSSRDTPIPELGERMVVSLQGRAARVARREFQRGDGTPGSLIRFTLLNDTGSIPVVIWDEELARGLEEGAGATVEGVVRRGPYGMELSARRLTVTAPPGELPLRTLAQLQSGEAEVRIRVQVLEAPPPREFQRPDGTPGRMRPITVGDPTGRMRGVLWGPLADHPLAAGTSIEIQGASVREHGGRPELHLGSGAALGASPQPVPYEERYTPLGELLPETTATLRGQVSGIGGQREVQGQRGPTRVANLHLSDPTGRVRVALWGAHADLLPRLDIGTPLTIRDARVRVGAGGRLEVSAGETSRVEIASPDS